MLRANVLRFVFGCSWLAVLATSVSGQCLDWRPFTPASAEFDRAATLLESFDDGAGPMLYIVENNSQSPLRRWNGTSSSPMPGGLQGTVRALAVFDDGTGPALYAGGDALTIQGVQSGGIVRWNGTNWSSFANGLTGAVTTIAIHDDGLGPKLYVGGTFIIASVTGIRVARWGGASWEALAIPPFYPGALIIGMASFDDGTGPGLFVGCNVISNYQGLYRWKNGVWSNPTPTFIPRLSSLVAWTGPSGPALYVAPFNSDHVVKGVLRWDGQNWSNLPSMGYDAAVLRVLDDGTGSKLYAGTIRTYIGGSVPSQPQVVQRWDGTSWTALSAAGTPFCPFSGGYGRFVNALALFDSGFGPRLFAGANQPGHFGFADETIGAWNGTQWERVGTPQSGLSGGVRALHVMDIGTGPALYASGPFCTVDTEAAQGLARWDGTAWTGLPNPAVGVLRTITALATYPTVTGDRLALTDSTSLQLWNGSQFTTLASTDASPLFAVEHFAGSLYVGGAFTLFGGVPTPNIGRWNGSNAVPVGGGVNGAVNALEVFDDGTGQSLYAGGTFTAAAGQPGNRIARWNGTTWSALGSGLNNLCDALVAFNDGSGPALYAAGTFTTAGSTAASCVARWKNNTWSAVGAGLNAQVLSLGVFDDGSGPALYAGGNFTASGSTPLNRIAKWDGSQWTNVGSGVDGTVWALQSFDDGRGIGPQLFVGGTFEHAANLSSRGIAAWRGCGGTIARYCFGDGSVAPCPCGNEGLAARGCDNSFATGGVRMNANGTTNPDTIAFYLSGLIPGTATLLFQGNVALSAPTSFGDGLLCAGGTIRRLELAFASSGALVFPGAGSPSISAQSAAAGDPVWPGGTRGYQAWYRDSNTSFCSPATSNVSNAVRIAW